MPVTYAVRSETATINNLLGSLPSADFALLSPQLERISLKKDDVLFEPGEDVTVAHFPGAGAVVSLVIAVDPGHIVETASIGLEGAVGGIVSHGRLPAYTRAIVRNGGPALRLPLSALEAAKTASPAIHDLFARYADCLLSQVLQSVACNALHTIDQRCAKWLLSTRDRVGENSLQVTHEALAQMLGVQRSYVSKVLGRFHRERLVKIGRGRVDMIDADELERVACECYDQVKAHFDRVLRGIYPEAQ